MIREITNVVVIGAGLMGSGIAQVTACAGFSVNLVDVKLEIVNSSLKKMEERLLKNNRKNEADEILQRVKPFTDLERAVSNADLVIEAVIENLQLKQKTFKRAEAAAPSHCLFATNTSSLRLSDIGTLLKDKSRFGGLHFFTPVPKMELLEVVESSETSKNTLESFKWFGTKIGKAVVVCKDTPGFIVNRLLIPYLAEAMALADRGVASIQDIDTAVELGLHFPIGPFKLADFIGLDVALNVQNASRDLYSDEYKHLPRSSRLEKLVKEGNLGRKTGKGFYDYRSKL